MEKILLILSKYELTMKDNETLSEFLSRITPAYKTYAPFLEEAVLRFEEIRYGCTEVSEEDADTYSRWKTNLLNTVKKDMKRIPYWILYFKANT